MNQGYTAYQSANIETADRGKLLIMCYDVAIKHATAVLEISADFKNIEQRNKHLYKINDALTELISALNFEVAGGEIATNLYRLYEYMQYRVNQAIAHPDNAPIQEILGYLSDLREAWKFAAQEVRMNAANGVG